MDEVFPPRNIGFCVVLMVELWGVRTALEIDWVKGIRNLCIDTNSTVSMKLLTGPPIHNNYYVHMVRYIKH